MPIRQPSVFIIACNTYCFVISIAEIGDFFHKEVSEDEYSNRFIRVDLSPAAGGSAEFTVVYNVDRLRVTEDNFNTGENSPEMIRRFQVIAMNTPIEFDIYAKANSSLFL